MNKGRFKRGKKIMLITFGVIISIVFTMIILLLAISPGKVKPYLDKEGNVMKNSISEKIFVKINGIKQGMFIQGENIDNPVLLFVHGGPIMPEFFLNDKYPTRLDKYFTICWWEQPGVGMSYDSEISKEDLTVDAIIEDTIEVTNYLRKRFNKDKIYLLGHSWGSFIGIQAVEKKPELYDAYIGVGQITNQKESEKIAYKYMIDKYTELGNSKMVNKLKEYNLNESDKEVKRYFTSSLRDETMHELGIGTTKDMKSVITGVFLPVMKCRAYTFTEKINIWRGKSYVRNNTILLDDSLFCDVPSMIKELEVPTYFISGDNDYTVSYELVEKYFNELKAPEKEFYLIKDSAHSPMFEKPEEFIKIMKNKVIKKSI